MKEIGDLAAKAERFLNTAEMTLGIGDYDSCASRCYYAMFFMATAALSTRKMNASSHKGVISLFGQHFVKDGVFGRDLGKTLHDAYDMRLAGDYGAGPAVTKDQAEGLLVAARKFVEQVRAYLDQWMEKEGGT